MPFLRTGPPAPDALGGSDRLDESSIRDFFQYPDLPDVDLLVRTAGEHRLSNFMLWHLAYAELVFLDTLWPDFRSADMVRAVDIFRSRVRTFGEIKSRTEDRT